MMLSEAALDAILRMPRLEKLYIDDFSNQDEILRLKQVALCHGRRLKTFRGRFSQGLNLQFEDLVLEILSLF
jgi:hypothetical protein